MSFAVAVDNLVLGVGGTIVPANKSTLSPPKLKRNWDVRPGFGLSGAFCVYTGEGLAAFDVTFEFWDEEKESLWDAWAGVNLVASKGTRPAALSIYHPILMKAPFKIQNVQVTDIEGWSLISPGMWQTRLTLLEYRPPAPFVPKKTEPVIPGVEKVPLARPQTQQDKRMANSAARLRWRADQGAGKAPPGDTFNPPYPDAPDF